MLAAVDPRGAARGHGPSEEVAFSDASPYAGALSTTVTSGELQPGDQLAGYEIEAVLGRGGMGVVYLAFDARLGRRVALKLIAPEKAQDERFRTRFLSESQLAASLDHSSVVPVYDAGEANGHLYISMRYVEGTDLRTLLARDAPLDPERSLALVGQVAAALDAAHARGLVHRDVKPANILVTEETGREHCYLSDFGLTRGPDPTSSQSEPAHLSGTVAYTSPEQIAGDLVSARADVYSLACVLYECLSGQPPFAGRRSMAVLVAHVQEPPPTPPAHPALGPVLSRALAKDPSDRYATAGEFVEEAVAALGGKELPPELDFRTPLVGREDDLRWLREAWEGATHGKGHVAVISGPRGMGKTRLAAELAREVRAQGGEVRYVSCVGGDDSAATALAEAGAVTTPVLLVIDDLDAANAELLDAVRHAGHAVASSSALVLATSRTPFPGAPHRELGPIDGAAVAELAASIAGDAAIALPLDTVLEETGGVPLAVQEVVAEWLRAEARRRLGEAALRAAAGRQELRAAQADLTSSVVDLQRALGRVQAGSAAGERVCPFKGLASFDVADADSFYGRERLVAELVARLPGATLLGVVGPSGSGKSSIVRAGLSAALGTGALPGSENWVQVVIRPGDHPLDELARARRGHEDSRLLLVVDQLEEVFTLCRDEGERLLFLDAVTRPAPHETVVVAVRADFYGRFAALPRLASQLAENHVLVGPMKAEDLRRAIELPSRRAGLRVEPALVDALVVDVVDEPGGLPLLSTALVELWQHRDDRTLRLDAYRESGGVRGAVARIAEEAYKGFTPPQQETARRILLRLASVEGDDAVRRRASLAELELDKDEDARHVVAVLTDSRLVTASEDALEVAHEALLREWPRLREWLEEDAEGRRLHGHAIRAAKEWEEADREPAELYRGARLAAALDWAAEHDNELNELERSFLAESQGASEAEDRRIRRTNRRLRLLLAGAVVFLAAAVAGGSFAVFQSIEAQRESDRAARVARSAQAGEIAAAVLDNYQGDPEGSILAAVEAVELTRQADGFVVPEAAEALTIALGATVNDALTYEAGVAPGTLTPTATSDQLLELARARVPRPMTDEECRFYLHLEACPPRSRELPRTVVPFVTGETEEVARARLERAGFSMRVTGTWPTGDPDKDRVVLEQSAGIADAQGRVWARPGLTVGVTLYRYTATGSADFGPQSGG
jgi:Novel STAND NTPase 1/Protein kinase domain/AAA ATPase domain